MNAPEKIEAIQWPEIGPSRVPYRTYTDPSLYQEELERFFYHGHWIYVGLECEIPNPGDFKRSWVGERSVIMVRDTDTDGTINVVENHCAHRGVRFCQKEHGNTSDFICPYHQWSYDLKGNLQGVPFRRGVKRDGKVEGGMPADFKTAEHGLTKLKVAARNGVVFASFDHDVEDFDDYLGELKPWFYRAFDGRKLTLLGYSRQRIPGNWRLMQENIKDPYHPGLLHTWFVVFGLWRADQRSQMVTDSRGRHAAMIGNKNDGGKNDEVTKGVASFKEHMKLHDDRLLDVVPEAWWKGNTACMQTIFPSLIIQHNVNSVSTRQIIPRGLGVFDFYWTHYGFEDDTPEMTRRRLRQANLFGPSGYVSADDGEVIEMQQQGFGQDPDFETISELGGRETGNADHMVTETLIRSMYTYYRQVMGL